MQAIVADPGVTIAIGETDTGKSTFCLQLLNAAVRAGVPAALVDSDMGQSEVGPPGTLGLALIREELDRLDQLYAHKLYFIGSTNPAGHLLPAVVGTRRLVDHALSLGSKLVVVDTTGLVRGALGRRLKTYKIDLIQPRHLVAIQRASEIEHLLASFSKNDNLRIHSLQTVAEASRKPQEYRVIRRRTMFYESFHEAEGHILHIDQVVCRNTYFTTGKPLSWRQIAQVGSLLGVRALHGETISGGLYLVTDAVPDKRAEAALSKRYRLSNVWIVPSSAFQHVVLGLSDGNGFCLDIGLLQAIDFRQRFMFILSSLKTISPVRIVEFGSVRVQPDGIELGRIRPGEI